MKRIIIYSLYSCLFLLLAGQVTAQDWYEWQEDKKVTLHPKEGMWVMIVADSIYPEVTDLLTAWQVPEENRYQSYNRKVVWITNSTMNQMEHFRSQVVVPVYVSPVFQLDRNNMKHTNGEVLVRWNAGISET